MFFPGADSKRWNVAGRQLFGLLLRSVPWATCRNHQVDDYYSGKLQFGKQTFYIFGFLYMF